MDKQDELAADARTLPIGTVVHIEGFPVRLAADAEAQTHPANWSIINRRRKGKNLTEIAARAALDAMGGREG